MLKCSRCGQDLASGQGCSQKRVTANACELDRIPYIPVTHKNFVYFAAPDPCIYCGVLHGFHHVGCAGEECPACHQMMAVCECDKVFIGD